MNTYENDILQIIPAPNWFAIHLDEGKEIKSTLVCWALQRNGDIVPFTVDYTGMIVDPTLDSNFVGISHIDDTIQYIDNAWRKKEGKI